MSKAAEVTKVRIKFGDRGMKGEIVLDVMDGKMVSGSVVENEECMSIYTQQK